MHFASCRLFCRQSLQIAVLLSLSILLLPNLSTGQIPQPKQVVAADEGSLEAIRGEARQMIVKIGADADARPCDLKDVPLLHYSDQVRQLPESTLWVWEQERLPVLFCKIERVTTATGATKSWQYCCVPATSQKTDVTWGSHFRWRSTEMPFHWSPITKVADPRDQPAPRLIQMKAMAREFVGTVGEVVTKNRQNMRLLASPLHRYSAPQKNVQDGAVFGLTANGTNPDTLLIIEARLEAESQSKWRFAILGMTADTVQILHRDVPVWNKPFTESPGDHRSWMWYTRLP